MVKILNKTGLLSDISLQTADIFCRKTTMTLIQKLNNFYKNIHNFKAFSREYNTKIFNFNPIILFLSLVLFSGVFFAVSNIIQKNKIENEKNLKVVTD